LNIDTSTSVWQGQRVRLRAIEPADWETYFAWNQDDEQSRRLYFIPFPQSQEAVKRFAENASIQGQDDDGFRFVIESKAGELVGDLTVGHCERRVGSFSYGINTKKEYRNQGYASEAVLLVLRYYFQEMRYQKVTVRIYSFNEPSIKLHEKLGFQQEGRIRRVVFTRGRYYDEFMYGMTAEEFVEKYSQFLPVARE
jgi:RimJ/RimL family protein N-acetyltransferase